LRRRVTRKLASLKSAIASLASSVHMPERTGRIVTFAALFLFSVLITLLVLLSGRNGEEVEPEEENAPLSSVDQVIEDFSRPAARVRQGAGVGTGGEDALSVQDFILPQVVKGDSPEPILLRPRLERWREEQVSRYWIPLEDIAADIVRRENDRRIEELFEDIP